MNLIVSFGANQIFKGKTTYTCLLILQNQKQEHARYYEVKNYSDWILRDYARDDFDTIPGRSLSGDAWPLVPRYLKSAFNTIVNNSDSLEDLIGKENIYNGIQTSANQIYIHSADKIDGKYTCFTYKGKHWKIETEVTKPYYRTSSGRDILNTYRPFAPNAFVIYPYRKVDKRIEFIEIDELKRNYPEAYRYLDSHKATLFQSEKRR